MSRTNELRAKLDEARAEVAGLTAELEALGRPVWFEAKGGSPMRRIIQAIGAGREWDAQNPEKASRRAALLQTLPDVERRAEEIKGALERLMALPGLLAEAGAPTRAVEAWAESKLETPALAAVRRFMAGDKSELLLFGGTGAGKTVASIEALATAPERAVFVRAIDASRLGFDEDAIWRLRQARVLVLDDLGTENLHDAWRPHFDGLLDYRHGESRKTVLTTNLDHRAFFERYGQRARSRFDESGEKFGCGDVDLRRQK